MSIYIIRGMSRVKPKNSFVVQIGVDRICEIVKIFAFREAYSGVLCCRISRAPSKRSDCDSQALSLREKRRCHLLLRRLRYCIDRIEVKNFHPPQKALPLPKMDLTLAALD